MRRPGLASLVVSVLAVGAVGGFVLRPDGPAAVERDDVGDPADHATADRPSALKGRGRARGTRGPAAGGAPASPDAVAKPPHGPTRVEGRVLDEAGRPIEGARVSAVGAPAPPPTTVTDADGRFALELPPPGTFPLRVEVPGGETLASVTLGASADVVASRTPTFPIAGRVVDAATGAGVVGVPVVARPDASPDASLNGDGPTATTGEDGAFVVGVRTAGRYGLHVGARSLGDAADADAYVPTHVDGVAAGTRDVVVRLTAGLAIEGRVLDDAGDLVARALRVDVVGRTARGDPDWSRRRAVRLRDGAMRVPGLAPGRYDVSVRPEPGPDDARGAPLSSGVRRDVEAGATGVEIRLTRGLAVVGRLVDDHGDAVTGAGSVMALPEGTRDRNLAVVADVPGDGTFRVGPLDDAARFDLVATGFAGRREALRTGVSPRDADVTLVLALGGRISGKVVTKDGTPAPVGVPVGVLARGTDPRAEGTRLFVSTLPDGSFVADGLGPFAFDVEAGGGRSGFLGVLREGVKVDTADVVLEVTEGVEVTGTLVDDAGAPSAATSLQADDGVRRAAMRPYVQVGPDGGFRFRGLKAGPVRFTVRVGEAWVDVGTATAPATGVKLTRPSP